MIRSPEHPAELGLRDYALLALLYLLPSADTGHKAKLSTAELPNRFIWFKPQQTGIDLFLRKTLKPTNNHFCFALVPESVLVHSI